MRVAFRADGGGDGLGFGHLMRCLALAEAFEREGVECFFVSRDYPAGVALVRERGVAVQTLDASMPLAEDLRLSCEVTRGAEIVVADSYAFTPAYLAGIGEHAFCVVFDDLNDRELPVDVVLANVFARAEDYRDKVAGGTAVLAGPEYAVVRDEFRGRPPRTVRERVEKVLVTMGGEDAPNSTERVVGMLGEHGRRLDVQILLGAAYRGEETLRRAIAISPHACTLQAKVQRVAELFESVDLAISAAGSTVWELAATGTPMVLVQAAANQTGILDYARATGLAEIAGWHDKFTAEELLACLTRLESDEARGRASRIGRSLIDGTGAERVAQKVLSLFEDRRAATSC